MKYELVTLVTEGNEPPAIVGDAPLDSSKYDEFGLTDMAKGLAATLASRIPVGGYTLGIEGPWGSGKSTFANFVVEELRQSSDQVIIRFEPWLIGEKSALIASFLGAFAAEIDKLALNQWRWWQHKRWLGLWPWNRLSNAIRKYGGYLNALSAPVGAVATIDPTGSTALAATGLKTAGMLSRLFGKQLSLDELKSKIVTGLHALQKERPQLRFTVFIDDTDRLEALEAVEILRLARKVADFPLVAYIVCFDGKILSKQVSTALLIADGREYLERIFQDVIPIPPQEPFALRRYLKRLLKQSFPAAMGEVDHETRFRMEMVFDRWCGRLLSTPRDVVRLYQSVLHSWPNLPPGSDFCDFVWLQLLKLKCHELYEWTRNYLQNVGSSRDRGRPGDTEPKDEAAKLLSILERFGWKDHIFLSGIDKLLPGLNSLSISWNNGTPEVFKFESGELGRYEQSKRLGSPSHWRGYFSFAVPSYAVKDEELSALRNAVEADWTEAARILRALLDRPHERTGHFLDVCLDRLIDDPLSFNEAQRTGLLKAFAEIMDDVERITQQASTEGHNEIWERTRFIFHKHPPPDFLSTLRTGKSVNWLAYIVRDQGFAAGKPEGGRQYPENAWLKQPQFDEAVRILTSRLEAIGMKNVFSLPAPLDVLFFWAQLGNSADVKVRFAEATKTHSEFLTALSSMRGWGNRSDLGVYHPFHAKYVAYFGDPDEVHARLERLAQTGKPKHQPLARELLAAWVPLQQDE